jgi:L,D-transpeptidase ErfK/SrfK
MPAGNNPVNRAIFIILFIGAGCSQHTGMPATVYGKTGLPVVIGSNESYTIREGDTLTELALKSGLGYEALANANPGIDPWIPRTGDHILLPHASLLPSSAEPGILINTAEMKLYHIHGAEEDMRVRIYPIGIGLDGRETPEGDFSILQKIRAPTWLVPATLRRERDLPRQIPPGPDNPLGDYWMSISRDGYGIHGTNEPFGVGRRVSQGCLRMYPEDIRILFEEVEIGTPVRIIYQPIKAGIHQGTLWTEVHPDFLGRVKDPEQEIMTQVEALNWRGEIDRSALQKAVRESRGIPVQIAGRSPVSSPGQLADHRLMDNVRETIGALVRKSGIFHRGADAEP